MCLFRMRRKLFLRKENIDTKRGAFAPLFCNCQINLHFIEYLFKRYEILVLQIFVAFIKPIVYTIGYKGRYTPLLLVVSKCC